jgi:protein-tyrosine phosphatase
MEGVSNATEILPGLWLGSNRTINNTEFMEQIDVVFNCTKNLPMVPGKKSYRLPVDDNLHPDEINMMTRLAAEAIYHINNEYIVNRKKILIHCHKGRQRSAAIVAMFLIFMYGMTPQDAVIYIRSKRPEAFLGGVNFLDSIRRFRRDFGNRCRAVKTMQLLKTSNIPAIHA